jgi:hypothetical protein
MSTELEKLKQELATAAVVAERYRLRVLAKDVEFEKERVVWRKKVRLLEAELRTLRKSTRRPT